MKKTSNELRQDFIDFFVKKDHKLISSSSLVPKNDQTLLFTNAGMVQFKDKFLGLEKNNFTRAVSSQRCLRAGGKHNDLENVGYTERHHTMFEMLGNFSFGDYSKKEAIQYAWEFITKVLKIPEEKLWCTVFFEDLESEKIWLDQIGIKSDRLIKLGKKNNFWAMGDTGPCGPCSEIFFDHGPKVSGGPPGSKNEEGDRFVEIWNLVFMQYERNKDGTLISLPKPSVDTGMGLERITAVMQGVHSNYEIDIFKNIIKDIMIITGEKNPNEKSLRVIADHIRASVFLISDGILPGNEGRGYVLRRIIRRAIRHGFMLGTNKPFFYKLVKSVSNQMGSAYPEITKKIDSIEKTISNEENKFAITLENGMSLLEEEINKLPKGEKISGKIAFKLYDTFGFPIDLTEDIAREKGLSVEMKVFETEMTKQKNRARKSSQFTIEKTSLPKVNSKTQFMGYDELESESKILSIYNKTTLVDKLTAGEEGIIILDKTPFYAEGGGQVGDSGKIISSDSIFDVIDTQKSLQAIVHLGTLLKGTIKSGDKVIAKVNKERRNAIVLNHSATHLLHAALRLILGNHIQQKGSLVAPDKLRFDFSHEEPIDQERIIEIESLVNGQIAANSKAESRTLPYEKAINSGALAFFGDKYAEKVRVMKFSNFSHELCGGTHVKRTGDIGIFKIISEIGVSSGVRRIEALTGPAALSLINHNEKILNNIITLTKSNKENVLSKIEKSIEQNKELEKKVKNLKIKSFSNENENSTKEIKNIKGIKILSKKVDGADTNTLREMSDRLKDKIGSGVVVLGTIEQNKVKLITSISKDLTNKINAGDLISPLAKIVGGSGGGRADFAQAGGVKLDKLEKALESSYTELKKILNKK
ncbi:MAG: alanine--tRNA ligase [Pseudomonadota bacterium]|nr:alanine--tRNA ligase [Gammaproteobacteria bacterium]MEE2683704.1 alanine--tRNA ligase [Pseudomonadota bacterium]|tara:strand:+ start:427 stop:3039 length:2613 start_codon:yes stop_codon:yes gene_type:complete